MKKILVSYSGGIGSFWAAKKLVDKYGKENVVAIFTDVNWEDEDLYKFIVETIEHLGIDLIYLKAPFDPLKMSEKEGVIYNSRMAACSRILKMRLQYSFILERKYQILGKRYDMQDMIISGVSYQDKVINPEDYFLALGIDWTEAHRAEAVIRNWEKYGYEVLFPLIEDHKYKKDQPFAYLEKHGMNVPRLYKYGFSHNNCGGRCFKAGQAHFKLLFEKFPERFKEVKEFEKKMNDRSGEKHSILTKTIKGEEFRYTLEELEKDIINSPQQIDLFDVGGCGCFIDDVPVDEILDDDEE